MSTSHPIVRRSRTDEWRELRDLRLRSLRSDPLAFGSTYERESHFDESTWRDRAKQGSESATNSQWIAESPGSELIGSAVIAELDGTVHLFAMWVDPAWRGRHVGSRLLDESLAWADRAFAGREVHLDVNPVQDSAVRLYASRGFRATGATRPLGHTPGHTVREMVRDPR